MKVNKNKTANFKGNIKRAKFNKKGNNPQIPDAPKELTRKALRKQARVEKKARKHAYFAKQLRSPGASAEASLSTSQKVTETKIMAVKDAEKEKKKAQKKLEKLQLKRRRQFMLEENEREEKQIAQLEKRLKIHRRKSKSLPQLFIKDGLDYLLDVCDAEKIPHLREPELSDAESDFGDDFALATGQPSTKEEPADKKKKRVTFAATFKPDADADQSEESAEHSDSGSETDEEQQREGNSEDKMSNDEGEESEEEMTSGKGDPMEEIMEDGDEEELETREAKEDSRNNKQGQCREDIYGRLRDEDGNVLENKNAMHLGRFVPPALRQASSKGDANKADSLQRLERQLKGPINRLSESNINPVSSQIEALYMHNIRNDMNNALINLVMKAIVEPFPKTERSVQEHALLITLLHANVGTEVGAQFLEAIVDKFELLRKQGDNYGDGEECNNLIQLLVHIYSFNVVHSNIIYDVLQILADSFKEKDVELILLILRSAGFSLRKDDPLRLKSVIVKLQTQASAATHLQNESRVRFMLDTLMAIRNNNLHKIRSFDPSHTEHLKKLLRSLIRKGNSIIELKISLDDLLNVESRGRWWIVGSAWSGQASTQDSVDKDSSGQMMFDATNNVSDKILELARKQRMNTDVRKNIFCIIMTAEDYMDAFEKLLRLGLNNQQEREIVHVVIECCLQEKSFNPYYAFLMQRFCNSDRKFQMIIQCSVWDKIKEMAKVPAAQMSNLAHLLAQLFLEKALAISVLKVIQFAEMDKALVRFLRQILLKILLHDPEEDVLAVFSKVAKAPKLHMFREGLRLFMRHFMLKNKDKLPLETHKKLEARIDAIEDVLTSCEVATKF